MNDHHPDPTDRLRRQTILSEFVGAALRGGDLDGPPSNLGRPLDARIATPHGPGTRFPITIPLEP